LAISNKIISTQFILAPLSLFSFSLITNPNPPLNFTKRKLKIKEKEKKTVIKE